MAEGSAGGQGRIPREVAVARIRKERSAVWEHYDRITTADGDKAKCKYCSAELAADTKRHGTGTLWSHKRRCSGQDGAGGETPIPRPPQPREAASESSNLKPGYEEACEDLARMIALRGYDSSVVEDDYFRSFVRRLDPAFEVPSRRTTEEMCDRIFDEAEEDLSSKLERALTSGRLNFATRTAKTIEGTILCAASHFIDDEWNLREMIEYAHLVVHHRDVRGPLLGIVEVDPQLQEDYGMADYLLNLVTADKIFSVSWGILSDHVQQNTSLEDRFSDRYPVKRQLIYTTYMDNALHSIAQGLLDITRQDDDDYLFYYPLLRTEHFTRQQREEHLLQLSLPDLWTYNERWYACYCSLEVVQKVRSSTSKADVVTFLTVGERESEFARLLRKLWGTIYRAIQTISAINRPTSNLCLIELFKVREALESKLEMDSIDEANVDHEGFIHPEGVPDVLSKARDTLDRSIQESYLVWSIPLVLDPRYKLSYRVEDRFKSVFGSEALNYISEIRRKLEDIFTDYSQGDNETSHGDSNGSDEMAVDSTDPLQQASQGHRPFQESKKELDRYLEDSLVPDTEGDDFDILTWWKVNSSTYPTVARMARDALAMPTCSKLSSELVSHIRSRVRGYSEQPFSYDSFTFF